jgi:hypothetical protein
MTRSLAAHDGLCQRGHQRQGPTRLGRTVFRLAGSLLHSEGTGYTASAPLPDDIHPDTYPTFPAKQSSGPTPSMSGTRCDIGVPNLSKIAKHHLTETCLPSRHIQFYIIINHDDLMKLESTYASASFPTPSRRCICSVKFLGLAGIFG